MSPRLLELHDLGVRTVLVGHGDAEYIETYVGKKALTDKKAVLVTDPRLESFRLAGMRKSVWRTIGFGGLFGHASAYGRGHFHSRGPGNLWQQAGALLVDGTGVVRYHEASRRVGDYIQLGDIVDVATALHVRSSAAGKGIL